MRLKETSKSYDTLNTDIIKGYIQGDTNALIKHLESGNIEKLSRHKLKLIAAALNNINKIIEE